MTSSCFFIGEHWSCRNTKSGTFEGVLLQAFLHRKTSVSRLGHVGVHGRLAHHCLFASTILVSFPILRSCIHITNRPSRISTHFVLRPYVRVTCCLHCACGAISWCGQDDLGCENAKRSLGHASMHGTARVRSCRRAWIVPSISSVLLPADVSFRTAHPDLLAFVVCVCVSTIFDVGFRVGWGGGGGKRLTVASPWCFFSFFLSVPSFLSNLDPKGPGHLVPLFPPVCSRFVPSIPSFSVPATSGSDRSMGTEKRRETGEGRWRTGDSTPNRVPSIARSFRLLLVRCEAPFQTHEGSSVGWVVVRPWVFREPVPPRLHLLPSVLRWWTRRPSAHPPKNGQ